jgi:hypothetical protein
MLGRKSGSLRRVIMPSKVRRYYTTLAAVLSFAVNAMLTMAFFMMPASWSFAWGTLQILDAPGDMMVEKLIGNSHGLGLVGIGAALAANFVIDWFLIYFLIVVSGSYLRHRHPKLTFQQPR